MTDRDPTPGDVVIARRTFSAADFNAFAALSGDCNPLHHDATYAASTAIGVPIVPALLAAAPLSGAAGMALPGHRSLILSTEIRALDPIVYDEEVVYSFRVAALSAATRVLEISALALQRRRAVLEGRLRVRIRDDVAVSDHPARPWGTFLPAGRPRRALVTGAGGAIGSACARALAAGGWRVTLQHRAGDVRALRLADELGPAARVEHLQGDLADPNHRAASAQALASMSVTAIVHAASPPLDAAAGALLEVNYTALRALVDAILPGMLEHQEGTIVAIGSEALRSRPEGWEDYVAAKTAAVTFLETIARRQADHGIRGIAIHPAYVSSKFSARHHTGDTAMLLPEEIAEVVVEALTEGERFGSELWVRPGAVEGDAYVPPPSSRLTSVARESLVEDVSAGAQSAVSRAEPDRGSAMAHSLDRRVERVARAVLRLDTSVELDEAALGHTANWNSLAQIELLLALEREFSIDFASADLSASPSLSELKRLVAQKIERRERS
jgi:NADP-dependent 3-hydroxy acid dehydrogenase YdfG/acyl dehydratase/acyl carrier protein